MRDRFPVLLTMLSVFTAGILATACGDGGGTSGDADAGEVAPDPHEDGEVPPDTPGDPDVTADPDGRDQPDDPVEEDGTADPDAVEDALEEDEQDAIEEADAGCVDPLVYHPGFDICVSTENLGRNCADGTSCEQGQACVLYYGIMGNPIYECHIECGPAPDRLCPEGYNCMDIADGPQNVCMD
jgi:hypothetical protein